MKRLIPGLLVLTFGLSNAAYSYEKTSLTSVNNQKTSVVSPEISSKKVLEHLYKNIATEVSIYPDIESGDKLLYLCVSRKPEGNNQRGNPFFTRVYYSSLPEEFKNKYARELKTIEGGEMKVILGQHNADLFAPFLSILDEVPWMIPNPAKKLDYVIDN